MTDKEENGEACGKETGEESKKAKNRFRSGTFLHILFLFKYCLPLLCGITLVVSGAFHSVRALQRGVQLLISPLRLSFETLREARAAIGSSESGHQIYFVLATGVILCFLFFCIGLFFAVLSAVCAVGADMGKKKGQSERFRLLYLTFFPNRILAAVDVCFFVAAALYPQIFAFISARMFKVDSTIALYIRFDLPLLLTGVLSLLYIVLDFSLRRFENTHSPFLRAETQESDRA